MALQEREQRSQVLCNRIITDMKAIISATVFILSPLTGVAGTTAINDTTRVLDEVVVVESAAKAPVPLLPLDVKIVGSATIDNSTETNLLPVLQNRIPGIFVTERGLAGYGVSGG